MVVPGTPSLFYLDLLRTDERCSLQHLPFQLVEAKMSQTPWSTFEKKDRKVRLQVSFSIKISEGHLTKIDSTP